MSSIVKIVPIREFDVAEHARAIRVYGKPRDYDGEMIPSPDDHAADMRRIAAVKRELSALTPTQRRSSRWPTKPSSSASSCA